VQNRLRKRMTAPTTAPMIIPSAPALYVSFIFWSLAGG